MTYRPKQRDIVIIDFAPSKGYEIKKRRPALVMSKDTYNISTNLVILCPITSLNKDRPFLVPVYSEKLHNSDNTISKVNTLQVYSLDYTEQANRDIKYVDTLNEETFYEIAQKFLQNFSFSI
ncbi:type II toxin-antitoxin system PemK/MazF family toxin [Enterococcus faecalis]|nr:type II toxin-antitoxin system PemK/MazF family toxin [Enterococcus faecalis]